MHDIKAYGEGGVAQLILNLGHGRRSVVSFVSQSPLPRSSSQLGVLMTVLYVQKVFLTENHRTLVGSSNKKKEIGRPCGTYGREEENINKIVVGKLKGKTPFGKPMCRTDGIIKMDVKK